MARMTQQELDELKRTVSLVTVVQLQGHRTLKRGRDVALCCPFHAEKTPSCVITPAKNLWHCFGCGAGGSVLDWVQKAAIVFFTVAVRD